MPSVARLPPWLTPSSACWRWLRLLGLLLVALLAIALALLLLHRGLLPVIAWTLPSLRPRLWDLAIYGAYPTQKFHSFGLHAPETSTVRWDASCDDGGLVLVSPFGPATPHDGPSILDARGRLVWTAADFDTAMNFRMQRWRGKQHLTFWAGQKSGSVGSGAYYVLDEAYQIVKKVHAVGRGLEGDMHEFEITEDGTALITIYTPRQVDMRAMGLWRGEKGWIMDSVFQEIDLENDELVFEWRASDHFRPEETFYASPFAGRWESLPFDFYHINSMQKDTLGNYLVSSRHLHTVSYINGSTGAVAWTLGGASHDLQDLSDGHASDFRWQHHARWFSEDERILSVFDNQAAGPLHEDAPYSKGVLIQLDLANQTARLLQTFVSVGQTRAASQGSVQLLEPSDRVFVGWGSSAAYTEFDMAGNALCETHLAAESTYWWERVKSYRAYKVFDWVGKPEEPPAAVLEGGRVYASWNGATGVAFWELQGSDTEETVETEGSHSGGESETPEWTAIDMIAKDGFEVAFALPPDRAYRRYRVAALDGEKMYMRYSDPAEVVGGGFGVLSVLLGVVAAGVCLAVLWFALKVWARRRRGRHGRPLLATAEGARGWELGRLATVFGRRRGEREYEYSKVPE